MPKPKTTKDTPAPKRGAQKPTSRKAAPPARPKRAKPTPAPAEPLALTDDELAPGEATPEDRKAWEQQPDEPVRWFDAFSRFRLAGSGRSLLGAYNAYLAEQGREKQVRLSGAWHQAAEKYAWRDRAREWDRDQRDIQEAEFEKRRRKLQDDSLGVAEKMVDVAGTMLDFPLITQRIDDFYETSDGEQIPTRTIIEPANWTQNTPARLMAAAEKIARLAHDMETTRILREMERLSDDELDDETESRSHGEAAP